jgi:hypothetical protein
MTTLQEMGRMKTIVMKNSLRYVIIQMVVKNEKDIIN